MTTAAAGQPRAAIRVAGRTLTLAPGDELLFGRGHECQIRLAHDQEDTQVSRRAGSLSLLPDAVLVRNLSATQAFLLAPVGASEQVVEPRAAITSLPHRVFDVVLLGTYGARYQLTVDATAVTPADPLPDDPSFQGPVANGTKATMPAGSDESLPPSHVRILAALCEPLRTGGSLPATYRQIGDRLSLSPGYVRNVLKQVRETLSGRGVPGLLPDHSDVGADLRAALARWALRAGVLAEATGETGGDAAPRSQP
jgi:hypothetical protein